MRIGLGRLRKSAIAFWKSNKSSATMIPQTHALLWKLRWTARFPSGELCCATAFADTIWKERVTVRSRIRRV
jgi:hypothetical protein